MRKGLLPPLLPVEVEPGEAVRLLMNTEHPFAPQPLPPGTLGDLVRLIASDPGGVRAKRTRALAHWRQRAVELRDASMDEIAAVPDDHLRRLYTAGRGPSPDAAIGTFVHVAWWRELALAADAGDQAYISEFLQGLPIVGRVAKSQMWAPRDDPLLSSSEDLAARAWEVREVVHSSLRRQGLHAHSQKLWDDAMTDVTSGAAIGPFSSFTEVDAATGSKRWEPTARFPVVQKNQCGVWTRLG